MGQHGELDQNKYYLSEEVPAFSINNLSKY